MKTGTDPAAARAPAANPRRELIVRPERGVVVHRNAARSPRRARSSAEVRAAALVRAGNETSATERFYRRYLDMQRLTLTYHLDRESGEMLAKILERYGRDEVRQIPPEHVVAFAARYDDWLGYVLDTRA